MKTADRKAVHVLSKYYNISSKSYGQPNARYIVLTKNKNSVCPMIILSKVLNNSKSDNNFPGNFSSEFFIHIFNVSEGAKVSNIVSVLRANNLDVNIVKILSNSRDSMEIYFESKEIAYEIYLKLLSITIDFSMKLNFETFEIGLNCDITPTYIIERLLLCSGFTLPLPSLYVNGYKKVFQATYHSSWWMSSKDWTIARKDTDNTLQEDILKISEEDSKNVKDVTINVDSQNKFSWASLAKSLSHETVDQNSCVATKNTFSILKSYGSHDDDDDDDDDMGRDVKSSFIETNLDRETNSTSNIPQESLLKDTNNFNEVNWFCNFCTYLNEMSTSLNCLMCHSPRNDVYDNQFDKNEIVCMTCTFINHRESLYCEMCSCNLVTC